jgi:DNA-binding transcriptional ArsR family regulator
MGRPAIVTEDGTGLPPQELFARVLRALGDASRIRIVEALARNGQMSQSELVAELGLSQSRASDHLACLSWCGFILVERQGRRATYRLAGAHALALVAMARMFVAENASALGSCAVLDQSPPDPAVPVLASPAAAPGRLTSGLPDDGMTG